jgi:hypothetical protein
LQLKASNQFEIIVFSAQDLDMHEQIKKVVASNSDIASWTDMSEEPITHYL